MIAHDQLEGRTFQYFTRVVGPALSGPQDAYFWTHLVMQFSHFAPAVRHAVLAISSLHEDFQNGKRINLELPGNAFALRHYNASIRHIQATGDENLVLLTCVLYLCVAYLLGDIESVFRHNRHGLAILSDVGCSGWARDHLLPIFRRLHAHPSPNGSNTGVLLLSSNTDVTDITDEDVPFQSLAEAEAWLCDLQLQASGLAPSNAPPRPGVPTTSYADREALRARCIGLLDSWSARVEPLIASTSSADTGRYLLCYLRATYETLRIQVEANPDESELVYDGYLDGFQAVVTHAEEAANLKAGLSDPTQRERACFTFEPGFLPVVNFTACRCRDLPLRLRALALMGKVTAAKEGIADVGTMYRITRRVIELEHCISLDDYSNQTFMPAAHLPPLENRILYIEFNHRLEVVSSPGDPVEYRREVKMIAQTPDGPRVRSIESITDGISGHCPGIPNMRSALVDSPT